jgi:hypothetical protein
VILRLRLTIPVPTTAVWRALTDVAEVSEWTGLEAVTTGIDYPIAGEWAIWRDPSSGVLLHDEILTVDPGRRLRSRLRRGPWLAIEDYVVEAAGPRSTTLRAEWRGHPILVVGNDRAMHAMVRAARARVRQGHGTQSGRTRSDR